MNEDAETLSNQQFYEKLTTTAAKEAFNKVSGLSKSGWYCKKANAFTAAQQGKSLYIAISNLGSRPINYLTDSCTDFEKGFTGQEVYYIGAGGFVNDFNEAAILAYESIKNDLALYNRTVLRAESINDVLHTGAEYVFDSRKDAFVPFERKSIVIDPGMLLGKKIYIR